MDATGRERLIEWVRGARTMPWEHEVVETVARLLGTSTLAVRREAYREDERGNPLSGTRTDLMSPHMGQRGHGTRKPCIVWSMETTNLPDVPADAVRALYADLFQEHQDGASSNDWVQTVDDWFTANGYPTIFYRD